MTTRHERKATGATAELVKREVTGAPPRYWSNVKSMLQCQGEYWNSEVERKATRAESSDTVLGAASHCTGLHAVQGDVKDWASLELNRR